MGFFVHVPASSKVHEGKRLTQRLRACVWHRGAEACASAEVCMPSLCVHLRRGTQALLCAKRYAVPLVVCSKEDPLACNVQRGVFKAGAGKIPVRPPPSSTAWSLRTRGTLQKHACACVCIIECVTAAISALLLQVLQA